MVIEADSEKQMMSIGENIGRLLFGGEIIELIGDVGSGKTTFVKGLAKGLGVGEYIQSPSFTINRVYKCRDNITLYHYDFYRLENIGIMSDELREVINEPKTVVIIEWAGLVNEILPVDRLSIEITVMDENLRSLSVNAGGINSEILAGKIII